MQIITAQFPLPIEKPMRMFFHIFSINPYAIRLVREIERRLWMVTPQIISRAVPKISIDLAERLCRNWSKSARANLTGADLLSY
jgi:hypothetical protein